MGGPKGRFLFFRQNFRALYRSIRQFRALTRQFHLKYTPREKLFIKVIQTFKIGILSLFSA